MTCDEVRELAPELALGIAVGEERAEALRHLASCTECRHLVGQLAVTGDDLLMLAPAEEPPLGFESRVVAALGHGSPPRRRRFWRLAGRLAPAVAAAAVTAVVLVSAYSDDRQIADRYRDTLATANGRYFQTEPLYDPSGARGGVLFGYAGSPSWVLVTVDQAHRDRIRRGQVVTEGGRTIPLGPLDLDAREGSWGGAIPVDLHNVASVRLLGKGGEVLEADLPHGDEGR